MIDLYRVESRVIRLTVQCDYERPPYMVLEYNIILLKVLNVKIRHTVIITNIDKAFKYVNTFKGLLGAWMMTRATLHYLTFNSFYI